MNTTAPSPESSASGNPDLPWYYWDRRPSDEHVAKFAPEGMSAEEYLGYRERWERGEIGVADLPDAAVRTDARGRQLIFGVRMLKDPKDRGEKRQLPGAHVENWKPTLDKPIPTVRCTHIKEDGEQCKRYSIRGGTLCYSHGAHLPYVRARAEATVQQARLGLVGLAPDAVGVLEDLMQAGTADAIRLKAATEILDRVGIKGALDINVEVEHKIDPGKVVADRLAEIAARNAKNEQEEDIIEVEILEEDQEEGEDNGD